MIVCNNGIMALHKFRIIIIIIIVTRRQYYEASLESIRNGDDLNFMD